MRLVSSTKPINTSAAAQARAWSSGDGDSDRVKIVTGMLASACVGSVLTWFAKMEEVKSSGAVSPAARATARIVPVRMPPRAAGRTIPSVVRQRLTPSAAAP
jgi:hypothetical protein